VISTREEAYQEASLRALKAWPKDGPPRDAAAWLIMVRQETPRSIQYGAKAACSHCRPTNRITDLADGRSPIAEQIDEAIIVGRYSASSVYSAVTRNCPRRNRLHWRCGLFSGL